MLRGELKQLDAEVAAAQQARDGRADQAAPRRRASADQPHPQAGGGGERWRQRDEEGIVRR